MTYARVPQQILPTQQELGKLAVRVSGRKKKGQADYGWVAVH